MTKLSIIVPLKNRSEYTKIYLENLCNEYFYFFADGSSDDKNEKLFLNLNKENVQYIRYKEDTSIKIFVEKINHVLSKVKSPYVMISDNDDFVLKKGINLCINKLDNPEKKIKAICSGGKITSLFQNNIINKKYSLPFILHDNSSLQEIEGINDIYEMFKNYRYLYYAVYKTKYLREFWADVKKIELYHVTVIEIFLLISTLLSGKYIETYKSHYLRLRNPSTSIDQSINPHGYNHTHKIFFDDNYRQYVFKMVEFICHKYNINKDVFLDKFKFFYISNFNISYHKRIKRNFLIRIYQFLKNIIFINAFRKININLIKKIAHYL